MSEGKKLVEFYIEKDYLIEILSFLASVITTAVVGTLSDQKKIGGIFLNKIANQPSEEYLNTLYVSVPIFDDDEHVTGFKAFEKEPWPLSLVSCTGQYINTLSKLKPDKDGKLNVKLFSYHDEDTKQNITTLIVYGHKGAETLSRVTHPDSLEGITPAQNIKELDAIKSYT
jgi:hypothetical protein